MTEVLVLSHDYHMSQVLSTYMYSIISLAYCSSPLLTSATLLGLQQTAVLAREGDSSWEKYSDPTRSRSLAVTRETASSSHLGEQERGVVSIGVVLTFIVNCWSINYLQQQSLYMLVSKQRLAIYTEPTV